MHYVFFSLNGIFSLHFYIEIQTMVCFQDSLMGDFKLLNTLLSLHFAEKYRIFVTLFY